jgi:hypothetical protein
MNPGGERFAGRLSIPDTLAQKEPGFASRLTFHLVEKPPEIIQLLRKVLWFAARRSGL